MDIDTVDAYTDRLVLTKYGLLGYDLLDRREGEDVTASSRDGGSQCLVCLYQSSIMHGNWNGYVLCWSLTFPMDLLPPFGKYAPPL